MKICCRCFVEKPFEGFRKNSKSSDGYQGACRDCLKTAYKVKYSKVEGYQDRARNRYVLWKYGISWDTVEEMYASQNGVCVICNSSISLNSGGVNSGISGNSYCIDHCHSSGKVRGLLCDPCNKSLGLLREDITTLKSAIRYLEFHKDS